MVLSNHITNTNTSKYYDINANQPKDYISSNVNN